jgi:hypothetical protein
MRICVLLSSVLLAGCATMMHGVDQEVPVSSSPPGAEVRVDGELHGVTPLVLKLRRESDYLVEISKPGYRPVTLGLKSTSARVAKSLLLGGMVGFAIDSATGATKQLRPDTVTVTLQED